MEGLATAAAAPSPCCQITIIAPFSLTHTDHTCEPHFSPTDPHNGTINIGLSAPSAAMASWNKRMLLVDFLVAQDALLHAAGVPRANLVWTD